MKTLKFNKETANHLVNIYYTFIEDGTQHKDKLVIKILANIASKLEGYLDILPQNNGFRISLKKPFMEKDEFVVNLEDSEFDRLNAVINSKLVTPKEAVAFTAIYEIFSEAEKGN